MASLDELDGLLMPRKEFLGVKVKPKPKPRPKPQPKTPKKGGVARDDVTPPRKTSADKKNKADSDGKKMDTWKKGAIGAGVLTAAVAGIIATEVALDIQKCDNATMAFTDVKPTGYSNAASASFFTSIFQAVAPLPRTVDITYTISSDFKISEGNDNVEINGTGTILDSNTFVIEKVVNANTIRIPCGSSDCSNVFSSNGTGEPQCQIADHLNDAVYDATKGAFDIATDGISSLFSGALGFIGPIIVGVIGLVILFFVVPILFSMFKGSGKSNTGSPQN
jgi:hypothetical protein